MNSPQPIFMLAALLGALGMWLLLPRRRSWGRPLGVVLVATSLGSLAGLVPRLGHAAADTAVGILAGLTVLGAVGTVTWRNPVYCAIWFGLSLLGTAGLLLFQGAQFLAVATVVVYAGAILVTFLFVLMLAHPGGRALYDRVGFEPLVSAASGAIIVGVLAMTVTGVLTGPAPPREPTVAELARGVLAEKHTAAVGAELFGRHLVAVEVAGTLLLAALVGAAVIVAEARRGAAPPAQPPSPPAPGGRVGREE